MSGYHSTLLRVVTIGQLPFTSPPGDNRGIDWTAGEQNGNAKLTNDQARVVYASYALGGLNQTQLGALFGVSNQTVSTIISGRRYGRATARLRSTEQNPVVRILKDQVPMLVRFDGDQPTPVAKLPLGERLATILVGALPEEEL